MDKAIADVERQLQAANALQAAKLESIAVRAAADVTGVLSRRLGYLEGRASRDWNIAAMDTQGSTQKLETFRDNAAELVAQVRQTGQPLTLTIDGHAAVVIHSIESHQRLLDMAAEADDAEAIRQGLEDIGAKRTQAAQEVFDELRAKYGIPR